LPAAFPIVGIGASAGGLEALQELLAALPDDTGMAFVIVQHLAPTHESSLPEILGRSTSMPVRRIEHGMRIEPNGVYVIPPGTDIELTDGHLALTPRSAGPGQHRPIDQFFESLAQVQAHRAIGVVLSGTGSDGSVGVQEIKAEGGINLAQDDTARQASMPHSAVATGAVDYTLAPREIAAELTRIARHPYVAARADVTEQNAQFDEVIRLLHEATGVDFSGYKRSTLQRRITRRVVLHKLDDLGSYLERLRGDKTECMALYDDVLISVTKFFRNPHVFEALKTSVFPRLIRDRQRNEALRVWVLGCATGEEAYSIAIAYREWAEASHATIPIQIFATDLNGQGIARARAAVYSKAIAEDVSADRLRRFFTETDGGYRVAKPIRDICIFAEHNVLTAPPFSRIDLLSCRNLLIYLDAAAQQRLLPMMHYALKPRGLLVLGESESIGGHRDLFDIEDPRLRIFARKPGPARVPHLPPAPLRAAAPPRAKRPPWPPAAGAGVDAYRESDRLLLTRFAPPAVLVNDRLEILQFRGETGDYLAPAPGKASLDLMKMLRDGLVVGVRKALHQARTRNAAARADGLRLRAGEATRTVNVEVLPVAQTGEESFYLVLFEEPGSAAELRGRLARAEARAETMPEPTGRAATRELARLRQELAATREYLQAVIGQQDAANEELQSANEEIQSANEELQSINEEMETSKEEIQSSNEELATVNDELQNRIRELSESNNDLVNLLASAQMPVVILGPDLRIRRITPPAERSLNLRPADVGRPITELRLPIEVPNLDQVLADVVAKVAVWTREMQDIHGRWWSVRISPYQTTDHRVEGAVVVLVDVDELKRGAEQLARQRA
jgi:two-component system, chemotaxis family, CheB/CheR fusion protein